MPHAVLGRVLVAHKEDSFHSPGVHDPFAAGWIDIKKLENLVVPYSLVLLLYILPDTVSFLVLVIFRFLVVWCFDGHFFLPGNSEVLVLAVGTCVKHMYSCPQKERFVVAFSLLIF